MVVSIAVDIAASARSSSWASFIDRQTARLETYKSFREFHKNATIDLLRRSFVLCEGTLMPGNRFFRSGRLDPDGIWLNPHKITAQPPPTSDRIKGLLSRALIAPETLAPAEIQELAASVIYHLIEKNIVCRGSD